MPAGIDPQDIFQNGEWYSRGGLPIVPQMLSLSSVSVGIGSSGSVAANGAVTLTTAMALTYPSIWLYFPAGALFAASSAGFYYCTMSSTTAAQAYNIRLTSGAPYLPSAADLTAGAIVAAGPGAYTQTTSTQLDAITISIPGGTMGPNGMLMLTNEATAPSSANAKAIWHTFGGSSLSNVTLINTSTVARLKKIVANRGVQNQQYVSPLNSQIVATGAPTLLTVDSSVAQNIVTRVQLTVATDYLVIESQLLEALPA